MRFFNTSGPVVAADYYCIPPLQRLNLTEVLRFIRDKRYFVLHAPRQTGKTSALLALRDLLNAGDDYRCVYVNVEGGLNVVKLMTAFQTFFREHSEHWVTRFEYREAGPQLLLQAFLQRIVNSGGRIEREYGLGRMRTDLLIVWPQGSQTRKIVIECKILHKGLEKTIVNGPEQTSEYMDRCAAEAGHLVVFDRREGRRWADKVFHRRQASRSGIEIDIWGM